jgi:UDP-glucose 4-epimerase
MNKVLVTGGAGFIGSHTVDLLLEKGVAVRVLDNLSTGYLKNLQLDHPNLEFVEGDIQSIADVRSAMVGVMHCIHLAAQVSVVKSIQDPVNSNKCNVQGFLNVLEAAREALVTKVVYASSAAIYGVPAQLPLDEASVAQPISPYGLEKMIDEQYANLYSELYGLSSLGLRYFNVYGPRQDPSSAYSGVISIFIDKVKNKQNITVFGDGLQTRDFVYVGDVARANVAALTSSLQGVCNIATGKSVTLNQLLDEIFMCIEKVTVSHKEFREGDIRYSEALPAVMHQHLGVADTTLSEGLSSLLKSLKKQ